MTTLELQLSLAKILRAKDIEAFEDFLVDQVFSHYMKGSRDPGYSEGLENLAAQVLDRMPADVRAYWQAPCGAWECVRIKN